MEKKSMGNLVIQERLTMLREGMQAEGIDFYMIPTADFHNSEYVSDYFKVREYYCGFTGSNGTLLVWQQGAGLWTDGRYFIQAEKELEGTGVALFRMLEDGVPTIEAFLEKEMHKGQTLGFDGRVIATGIGLKLEACLKEKDIQFRYDCDLAGDLWQERPLLPAGKIKVLSEEVAGVSFTEKLSRVREAMRKTGAEGFFLSKLDDIMWLFNIRGCDVACNPVALSYAYITEQKSVLFVQEQAVDKTLELYLEQNKVELRAYHEVAAFLQALPEGGSVLADKRYCSYSLYKAIVKRQKLVDAKNPTEALKAMKNVTELANMEKIYLKDSVAVTRFIYWLKQNIGKTEITEITAADYLEGLRREIPEFLDLSFPTISAYKENAAMMHYEATPDSHAVLKPEGMLLVDSGGQYMGGTTDVTRTIVLGEISEEIKKHYTLTVAGMLQMSHAKWLYGCTGRNLDILARQPLWDVDIDYQCGTGHGVGYILNVHEGPQNLRWRLTEGMSEAVLEEGMDVTNEPGVYIAGSHGIRIENVMVVKKGTKNQYGQFMHFDTLTYVPIDLEAIDIQYLSPVQRSWLNQYHQAVYERIASFLSVEEQEWLKKATRAI